MFHTLQQIIYLAVITTIVRLKAEPAEFRILAPEFICPKDEEATLVQPDNTIITIRTKAGSKLHMRWTVRWSPLPAPAQRSTLLLWRATRALEKKLNGPQPEPYVYVIENDELLPGVNYIFNVTGSNPGGEATAKAFHINNVQGDKKLEHIEGRADLLSIVLVGGQDTYADVEFMLEALVTTCYPTQDYYFEWTIQSTETDDQVDTALTSSRLEIPANSLRAGLNYHVTCQVVRQSNEDFITQNDLLIRVLQRTFEVYLNVEHLLVSVNSAFTIESLVLNHDYFGDTFTYEWQCTNSDIGEPCDSFQSANTSTLDFENGFSTVGRYEVALTVSVREHSATASAVIVAVPRNLPIIQISPLPRILNEGTTTVLVANASNVTPQCSLTWYFASEEYLLSQNHVLNDSCDDCEHGEPLTETLTIYSLEENFLDELTDFSNETEWRQVTAEMPATAGRARFVVQCACGFMYPCNDDGFVYADVLFKLNGIPKTNGVMVTPEAGSALGTIFRVSTLAAADPNSPLFYTFLCRVGINSTLVLGSYSEHMAVETFLPYIADGTEVWVEVCDVLGACSRSASKVVTVSPGDGATVATLLEDTRAHIRRCELLQLQRLAVAAVITYKNAGQSEAFEEFCTNLQSAMPADQDNCLRWKPDKYEAFLMQLAELGCDTTPVIDGN